MIRNTLFSLALLVLLAQANKEEEEKIKVFPAEGKSGDSTNKLEFETPKAAVAAQQFLLVNMMNAKQADAIVNMLLVNTTVISLNGDSFMTGKRVHTFFDNAFNVYKIANFKMTATTLVEYKNTVIAVGPYSMDTVSGPMDGTYFSVWEMVLGASFKLVYFKFDASDFVRVEKELIKKNMS